MDPHTHFLFPFVIAFILSKLNIISWKFALVCGFIGAFVDIDHYVEHILHSKSNKFSLKDTWNNAMRFHHFEERSFIHDINGAAILTVIFVIILFFNWKISLILAIGYYSHLFLDYIHINKERFLKWKISTLYIRESNLEMIVDIILVIVLIIVLLV